MSQYRTYMFNLPKISEAGESIPAGPYKVDEFTEQQTALDFVQRDGHAFERVAVMEVTGDTEQIISLFHDGKPVPIQRPQQAPLAPVTDSKATTAS